MMERISIKAELSDQYTNHCSRAVHQLWLCSSAVYTQRKSVQSQSTKMNAAFPSTSGRQQVHEKAVFIDF